jgi:predicted protein tyrosine phosphatase
MIKRIYAVPRQMVGEIITQSTAGSVATQSLLVSICSSKRERILSEQKHFDMLKSYGFGRVLELFFVDTTLEEFPQFIAQHPGNPTLHLFSHEDARKLVDFINENKYGDIDRLLVHCDAGKSRSGAVAAWAFRYLSREGLVGKTSDQFWADNRQISPNPYVAKILCSVSGIEYREEDF